MRHKNKKSLKNLKQFRVRSKFVFYVLFRPVAQKWFFPVVGLILLGGILNHEATKEYVFTNPKVAAVEAIRSMPESSQTGSPVAEDTKEDATLAKQPLIQTSGSSTSTIQNPVRASDVEALIREVFAEEAEIAIAIAKSESGLRADAVGDIPIQFVHEGKVMGHSCGLFQIRVLPGRPNCEELKDPDTNVKYAKKLQEKYGWFPWSNYKNDRYKEFL